MNPEEIRECLPELPGICQACIQTEVQIDPHLGIVAIYCPHWKSSAHCVVVNRQLVIRWNLSGPVGREDHDEFIQKLTVGMEEELGREH
jgi:hypothetical protein